MEGTAGAKKASSLEIVLHTIRSMMVRNSGHFHRILLDGAKETESLIDLFKTILQKGKDLYGAYEDFAARTYVSLIAFLFYLYSTYDSNEIFLKLVKTRCIYDYFRLRHSFYGNLWVLSLLFPLREGS